MCGPVRPGDAVNAWWPWALAPLLTESFSRNNGICLCSILLHILWLSAVLPSDVVWLGDCTLQIPFAALTQAMKVYSRSVLVWVCHGSFIDFTVIHRSISIPCLSWESTHPQQLREPCAAFPYLLLAMRVNSQGFQLSAPSVLSQGWASLVPRYGQTFYPELH